MKICPKCGNALTENETICPLCGTQLNTDSTPSEIQNNPFEFISGKPDQNQDNLINNLLIDSDFSSPTPPPSSNQNIFEQTTTFELPALKNKDSLSSIPKPKEEKKKNIYFSDQPQASTIKKNSIDKNNIIIFVTAILVIIIVAGSFIFINKIALNEQEENETPTLKETTPESSSNNENNNQTTEETEYIKETLGSYTFTIPSKYTTASYGTDGLTINDNENGYTITLTPGAYSLSSYRTQQSEIKQSMENDGIIVSSMYDDERLEEDLLIIEVTQTDELSYIMAIIATSNDKTLIINAADVSNPTTFNYDILDIALEIVKTAL